MNNTTIGTILLLSLLSMGCVSNAPTIITATNIVTNPIQLQNQSKNNSIVQEVLNVLNSTQNDSQNTTVNPCQKYLPSNIPSISDYTTQSYQMLLTGTSMIPFIISGSTITIAKVPVSDIKIGDVVCWSDYGQGFGGANPTELAIKMQQGVPVFGEPDVGSLYDGGVCHQIVWRDDTRFITQGTNNVTNTMIDALPIHTFADNYKVKVLLPYDVQQQLYQFWKDKRSRNQYPIDGKMVSCS